MRAVKLNGLLMNNGEFMCMGKVIQLNKSEIKKYIEYTDVAK